MGPQGTRDGRDVPLPRAVRSMALHGGSRLVGSAAATMGQGSTWTTSLRRSVSSPMMRPVDVLQRHRVDVVPFLSTLLVGVLLVAGAHAAWPTDPCTTDQLSAQATPRSGSAAIQLEVLSSSNKAGVMAEMACRFER